KNKLAKIRAPCINSKIFQLLIGIKNKSTTNFFVEILTLTNKKSVALNKINMIFAIELIGMSNAKIIKIKHSMGLSLVNILFRLFLNFHQRKKIFLNKKNCTKKR
ncbi:MAG: hypothetical protein K2X39_01490, partial [Silvanigrellaceae bacterium]|nr:hypothetical protein [Silvanigrellaceae bacterium]